MAMGPQISKSRPNQNFGRPKFKTFEIKMPNVFRSGLAISAEEVSEIVK